MCNKGTASAGPHGDPNELGLSPCGFPDRLANSLTCYFSAPFTTTGIFKNSSGFNARDVNRASNTAPLK